MDNYKCITTNGYLYLRTYVCKILKMLLSVKRINVKCVYVYMYRCKNVHMYAGMYTYTHNIKMYNVYIICCYL